MKKLMFLLAITFVMITNVDLKADITIGQVEPCIPEYSATQFDWGYPFVFSIASEECPGCTVLVEFYLYQQDNITMIQIVRIYQMDVFSCMSCLNYNQVIKQAYKDLFYWFCTVYGSAYNNMLVQKACKKWVAHEMTPTGFPFLTIPTVSIVNPSAFPNFNPNSQNQTLRCPGYWEVCDAVCCCWWVDVDYNQQYPNQVSSIATGDPCIPNANIGDCPLGCTGGCSDLEFQWDVYNDWDNDPNYYAKRALNYCGLVNADIGIVPNPTSDNFDLTINSETNGNTNITIIDQNGKYVTSVLINKVTNTITRNFTLNNYSTGQYYYYILIDGNYAGSGMIILEK
ncbi:MAG: T9SS type A sorting domain-containing protein [bacterium]